MIFNEIYSCYYNAVAQIISAAIGGELDRDSLLKIIDRYAFPESALTIEPALLEQKWQLIADDYTTQILNKPTMPLTDMQLRWLKTISLDRKAKLFDIPENGLEGVEPLFLPEDIVYYDRYSDGDPYDDDWYVTDFKLIRQAIRENKKIRLKYQNSRGRFCKGIMTPKKLEYSDRDDKFRLQAVDEKGVHTINLARLYDCRILDEEGMQGELKERKRENATFILYDNRNTLERAMIQFAQYDKEVLAIGEKQYQVCVWFAKEDETDLLIQLLSFGPMIKVIGSEKLLYDIKIRLKRQYAFEMPIP